jgi:hypothetical protein
LNSPSRAGRGIHRGISGAVTPEVSGSIPTRPNTSQRWSNIRRCSVALTHGPFTNYTTAMEERSDDLSIPLRAALNASTANIPKLEGAVAVAQERLRRELTKVEKLRELIALYEADVPAATATQMPLTGMAEFDVTANAVAKAMVVEVEALLSGQGQVTARANVLPKKVRMIQTIQSLLSLRGSVHRKEILSHLQNAGLMGHERNPMAHLAAFLSGERDKFASDGRGNFTLVTSSVAAEPKPTNVGSTEVGGDAGATSAHL